MSAFKITKKDNRYYLEGPIDASSDFSSISAAIGVTHVDLKDLTLVNSMGIKNWVQWVGSQPDECILHLHHCPRFMVEQFNTVWNFLKDNVVVQSFYVPYYCESLDEVFSILYERGKDFNDSDVNIRSQIKVGPTKERTAELDVFEKKYFSFILNQTQD